MTRFNRRRFLALATLGAGTLAVADTLAHHRPEHPIPPGHQDPTPTPEPEPTPTATLEPDEPEPTPTATLEPEPTPTSEPDDDGEDPIVDILGPSGALVVAGRGINAALYEGAHFRVGDYARDQDAVNDAIAAGAQVELVGTFNLTGPIVNSRRDLTLMGQGSNTILQAADGFPHGRGLVETGQTGAYYPNVTIMDLLFNGRHVGANIDGLRFHSYRGRVINCWFQNFSRDGLRIDGDNTNKPTDAMFAMINSGWNGGVGINGVRDVDVHYAQLIVHGNGGGGLNLNSASQQVSSVHAYSNRNYGIRIRGARTKLTLCKIEHNDHGIFVQPGAWQFQVAASSFRGGIGENVSDLIHVADGGAATTGMITDNHFLATDDGGARRSRHAIRLTGACRRFVIVGNKFDGGFGAETIRVAGSDHVIESNRL